MGATTFETVVTSPIPPEKLFKAGVIDSHNLHNSIPHAVQSAKILHGDGGPGTHKHYVFHQDSVLKELKHSVDGVDEENFTYNYTITDCGDFLDGLEKITLSCKVEHSASGGSVCKNTTTFHTKDGAHITEEQFKEGEKEFLAMFTAHEEHHLANPSAY